MQFISVIALFAAATMATPTPRTTRAGTCNVAGVLYGQAQCCATNVLNVAALDCKNRTPTVIFEFMNLPFANTNLQPLRVTTTTSLAVARSPLAAASPLYVTHAEFANSSCILICLLLQLGQGLLCKDAILL